MHDNKPSNISMTNISITSTYPAKTLLKISWKIMGLDENTTYYSVRKSTCTFIRDVGKVIDVTLSAINYLISDLCT